MHVFIGRITFPVILSKRFKTRYITVISRSALKKKSTLTEVNVTLFEICVKPTFSPVSAVKKKKKKSPRNEFLMFLIGLIVSLTSCNNIYALTCGMCCYLDVSKDLQRFLKL